MRHPTGVIILLGAPNDDTGQLSSLALERCEQAVLEYRITPGHVILPTGGFGEFNRTDHPHAFYTRRWLLERGVPEGGGYSSARSQRRHSRRRAFVETRRRQLRRPQRSRRDLGLSRS